jgi:uncharacterized protein (DUF488 family)
MNGPTDSQPVWTIGHSTRTADELRAVLAAHEIAVVLDVRRFAASRRLPQFSAEALQQDLATVQVDYRWLPSLGGRRAPVPASVNDAWHNSAFRGYADHVATEEFADGLIELLMLAHGLRTAVMCAELLWWRCHRRLIADVLVAMDYDVIHIRNETMVEHHRLIAPARLVRGSLTYSVAR